jgi:hypothetical protein
MATFYAETGTLVDEWNVDDVQQQRPDLNHEQACEVLALSSDKFDVGHRHKLVRYRLRCP